MARAHKRKLDIISPVFNEEESIGLFLAELSRVVQSLSASWDIEIVLVDDCSTDDTYGRIVHFLESPGPKPALRVLSLERNAGHPAAISAGILNARSSSCALVLDSDLQDPPETIPSLLEALADYEVVRTRRISREDSLLKKLSASLFYRVMQGLTGGRVEPEAGDFWAISERQVERIKREGLEKSVFFRGLIRELSSSETVVSFKRRPRQAGVSKYTLPKMINLALSGLGNYSDLPLRLIAGLTSIAAVLGIVGLVVMFFGRLTSAIDFSPGLVIFSFVVIPILATNAMSLSVLALYLSRLMRESSPRSSFFVSRTQRWNYRAQ